MNGLTKEQIERMVRDAVPVCEDFLCLPQYFNDLCCHVKALAGAVEFYRREKHLAASASRAAAEEHQIALQEIERQRLLLIRKNEALAVFATGRMWKRWADRPRELVWNGDGAGYYSDPMAFAKREAEATEPDNREE